jgi:hypothetical protein
MGQPAAGLGVLTLHITADARNEQTTGVPKGQLVPGPGFEVIQIEASLFAGQTAGGSICQALPVP